MRDFEDLTASLQYAVAAIEKLDEDYGMDSSDHIKILRELIIKAQTRSKEKRKSATYGVAL